MSDSAVFFFLLVAFVVALAGVCFELEKLTRRRRR